MALIKSITIHSALICILILGSTSATAAEVDPRANAVGKVALYGTAGGALLGLATVAFDGSTRNIFKGASLGLYAGLLFGGYIIYSHESRKAKPAELGPNEYPEDGTSPYSGSGDRSSLLHAPDSLHVAYFNGRGELSQSLEAKAGYRKNNTLSNVNFSVPLMNLTF